MNNLQINQEKNITNKINISTITDEQIESLGYNGAQKLTTVTDKILQQVKASDLDEFGGNLNRLVVTAKKLDPSKFAKTGFFYKILNYFFSIREKMLSEYASVDSRMGDLVNEMDLNNQFFISRYEDLKAISVENKLVHESLLRSKEEGANMLEQLKKDLILMECADDESGLIAQEIFVLKNRIERLEKRIDDIGRSILLSKQMHPQIELLKNNNKILTAKFLDVKHVTIPAWKNAFGMYVLQLEQHKAAELVKNIHEATDAAFKMQADLMRQNVSLIAEANQKSVVSYEVLEHINKQLIGAFDDMEKINQKARADRKACEPKIKQLEQDLINRFSIQPQKGEIKKITKA